MGLEYDELEKLYQEAVAKKEEIDSRTDLNDEEKENLNSIVDRNMANIQDGIIALATKEKEKIMSAIAEIEAELKTNEDFREKAEKRKAELQAEIDEETAKGEEGDQDKIKIWQAEIDGIKRELKKLPSIKTLKNRIRTKKKDLLPLMDKFKDKGVFTQEEIDDLSQFEARSAKAKTNFAKKDTEKEKDEGEPTAEEPTAEEPVADEEPVVEETAEEEPIVTEEPIVEPIAEEPVATEEPVVEEPVAETVFVAANKVVEPSQQNVGTINYVTDASSEPEVAAEEPKMSPQEEFKELYKKAKNKDLSQRDFDKLVKIMSDTKNYDELGITTGILRNKSKVILKAMGEFATTNIYKSVSDAKEYFGVEVDQQNEEIIPTDGAYYWRGIKSMAENSDLRLASQDVLERVIIEAHKMGEENLNEMQKQTLEKAHMYLINIYGFEDSIAAYADVKARRRDAIDRWFGLKKDFVALAEKVDEKPEKEVVEPKKENEFKEEEFFWEYTEGEYTEPVDTFASKLQQGVFPPEEIKETVEKTEKESTEKEVETDFTGPGIDG